MCRKSGLNHALRQELCGVNKMQLADLINELQTMHDKYGDCTVAIANDRTSVLDLWYIDRVCFFKDGEEQTVIIVED